MAQEKLISDELKITIVNYLSGRWNECNSLLLKSWLEESEENSRLFRQFVELWEADKMLRGEKEFNVDEAWDKLESKIDTPKGIIKVLPLSLKKTLQYAAILVFVLLLGGKMGTYFSNQADKRITATSLMEYSVPYGSKTSLRLPDGSQVKLNAGTTIKYNQGYGVWNRNIQTGF